MRTRPLVLRSSRAAVALAALALIATTFTARGARAGGFTIPLVGARMAGRMAFVGYADDTSAMYHNPSGLMLRKGYRFDLTGSIIYSGTVYDRYTGNYTEVDGPCNFATRLNSKGQPCSVRAPDNPTLADPVRPSPRTGILPSFGFSGDFGLKNWRFGIAVLSPHNATGAFPEDGTQRYQTISGTIFTLFVLPTVAWQPTPWLAVGAQFGPTFARIAYKRTQSLLIQDGQVDLDASAFSFAWGVGLTIGPFAGLRIGLSYSSATNFNFTGDIRLSGLDPNTVKIKGGDPTATEVTVDAKADFEFPRIIRAGLNYRFSDQFDIGLDFYFQNYQVYDAIRITLPQPLTLTVLGRDVEFKELVEPKNSKNVIALAFGGRYSPIPSLDLRAGVIYDQSPYPDNTYTILSPDADKLGFSIGASYRFSFGLEISVAYVHLYYFDRKIAETQVCQRIPDLRNATSSVCAPDTQAGGEVTGKHVPIWSMQASYSF